jgi:TM2 domain-containing membrane protein YozV
MTATEAPAATGSKSWIAALLLCFFVGSFGVHRFYVGKIGTGILMLITFGGLGLWTLIDFIMIAIGKFSDKQGNALAR